MKINFFLTLLFILHLTAYGQQTSKSITQSSWIGKIKMGDTNPELVFNIFSDSSGALSGDLGLPSKGIQGIPLSRVHIENDSIVLEISAAQASYKGIFAKDKMTIDGIWTESQSIYPLILKPLNKEIDYDNYKKENASSLDLEYTSKHFNFHSEKDDVKSLESLSKTLENNYLRITQNMRTTFNSKIQVFIYPSLTAFHNSIGYPDAPEWVVGAAGRSELKMVSPINPGSVHTEESLKKAIVHELVHAVVLNFRKGGLVGLPIWLNEGYAFYEADQLGENEVEKIKSLSQNNELPTWQELEQANTSQFGDMGGYGISASIAEFLIETYGYDKLKQFIIAPENTIEIYEVSIADLETLWLASLNKK
jgi:hypothetical protein